MNNELIVDEIYEDWQWQTAFELACHCIFFNQAKEVWISLGLSPKEKEVVWQKAIQYMGVKQ